MKKKAKNRRGGRRSFKSQLRDLLVMKCIAAQVVRQIGMSDDALVHSEATRNCAIQIGDYFGIDVVKEMNNAV